MFYLLLIGFVSLLLFFIYIKRNKKVDIEKLVVNSHLPVIHESADRSGIVFPYEDIRRMKEVGTVYWVNVEGKGKYELHVSDPSLIRQISIKDFNSFVNHISVISEDWWDFREILDFLNDEKWKVVRNMLSPVFSSGKLKAMYPLMEKCAGSFIKFIKSQDVSAEGINFRKQFGNFILDATAKTTLKVDVGDAYDPQNKFVKDFKMTGGEYDPEDMAAWAGAGDGQEVDYVGKKNFIHNIFARVYYFIFSHFPFLDKWIPGMTKQEEYSATNNFFRDLIKTRSDSGVKQNDFLDILVEFQSKLNTREFKSLGITENTLISQAGVFFFGGYDSTASAGTFLAFELAKHPKVQEKLFQEIQNHRKSNTESSLTELEYLNACLLEILRLYPPIIRLARECNKAWSCGTSHNISIPPGLMITFAVWASNRHPEVRPIDPEVFNPDYLIGNPETKSKISTFGHGPRICIGNRFAMDILKVFFYNTVPAFRFELPDAAGPDSKKIEFKPGNTMTSSFEPVQIKLVPRG